MFNLADIIQAIRKWEDEYKDQKNTKALTIDMAIIEAIETKMPTDLSAHYDFLRECEERNQKAVGLKVPLGVTAVMGPGSSGKSTWMREMYEQAPDHEIARFMVMGEVGALIPYQLKEAFMALNSDTTHVLLLDSWKDIWNDYHFGNGILQTGGINTAFTAFLGLVSQTLFLLGKSLIVVLNPQTAGERESVYQMVNSQCAGMLRLSGTQPGVFDYAQGRMIDDEKPGAFSSFTGIPVKRCSIFEDESFVAPGNPMSALFNKSII